MGIGFVAAFWLVVAVFLGLVFISLHLLSRRFRFADILKKAFAAVVVGGAIFAGVTIGVQFASGFWPSRIFESNFGFAPPPDVTDLRGRELLIGDGGDGFLQFHASKETVEKIVADRFFEIGKRNNTFDGFPQPNPVPAYWKSLAGPSVRFFKTLDHFDHRFGSSQAYVSYDEASGIVQFYWRGVD